MDERLRFVARLLDGEKMAVLCREFDISRKTGYKIFQRYKDFGAVGLTDRSRRPYRQANQLPMQIETLIVRLRREHPSWGAPKIREKLRRLHDDVPTPAMATLLFFMTGKTPLSYTAAPDDGTQRVCRAARLTTSPARKSPQRHGAKVTPVGKLCVRAPDASGKPQNFNAMFTTGEDAHWSVGGSRVS